jgi:hypothetical protein
MTLKDSRAKLRRAQEHFDMLKGQIDTFLEAKPYRVVVDPPVDDLFIVRLDNAPDIPAEDWALIIGDCVHNLRAALDYIAWRLAGSDPDDTNTQFPIFLTTEKWDRFSAKCIKRMKPEAQAILKKGQPFDRPDPENTALGGIYILDNADKHKLLTVVAACPRHFAVEWAQHGGTPDVPPPAAGVRVAINPAMSGNTVLAAIHDPYASSDVQMQPELTPDIAFGQSLFAGPNYTAVLDSLEATIREVATVIETFEGRPDLFPS